ncbi:GPI anchored protein [Colletotrichum truncatum]|uniref:GPI anchored protein n=1 Tax=Colletotrichum truncatum TaxID=5467 RepID=A0ACC3Z3G5_COLTU|nr:GPI anchored protein [Colletotrichum truncatum]XP_036585434.1 GPI anchored protein [Colletotrichum truncatum]KAF6780689.1 GPI anchored protein [Colletotrichum truncatum]KAF6795485.1 GPI anchored protein [Colletotrichum truncatum]
MVRFSALSAAGLALCGYVAAHPGEHHDHHEMKRNIQLRDNVAAIGQRSLNSCSNSAGAQKMKARAVQRRAQKVKEIREKKGLKAPARKYRRDSDDLTAWEAVNHNQTGVSNNGIFTPLEDVFSANTSCVLAPEITDGPYYVVGEYMRSNVIESEYCDGVPLFLEVQYVDVSTCEPIPAVAVDIWNCNATGIYSGISTNGNYAADGLNSTFLRGIQLTDHDGVVQFETIFPGHYEGRATHTHLLSHTNATVMPNGTISVWDAPVSHIGQLFWPESLRSAVEELAPYNTNTQSVTSNAEDMWSVLQADASYDPFPQFVYLSNDLQDGLFAWIQIGVNASADYTDDDYYSIAGYIDENGGHSSGTSFGGGGGGAPGGGNGTANGTAPSGAPPSGTGAPPS